MMPRGEQAAFKRLERALGHALAAGVEVNGVDAVPGRVGGRPCIAGTRIDVLAVWTNYLQGSSLRTMRGWWPHLAEAQLNAALRSLRYAVRFAKNPTRTTRRRAA